MINPAGSAMPEPLTMISVRDALMKETMELDDRLYHLQTDDIKKGLILPLTHDSMMMEPRVFLIVGPQSHN